MISFLKTNAQLRKENAELSGRNQEMFGRLYRSNIQLFKDVRHFDELEAQIKEADGIIDSLRLRNAEHRDYIAALTAEIDHLSTRLNQLSHPPRDPVTGRFVKVGEA